MPIYYLQVTIDSFTKLAQLEVQVVYVNWGLSLFQD